MEFDGEEFRYGPRMTVIKVGPATELNVFEIDGNSQADHQTPMFVSGRLDHIGLHAASLEDFNEIRSRLTASVVTDGTVTDFGRKVSLFFRDPDRMECERVGDQPRTGPGPHWQRLPPLPVAPPQPADYSSPSLPVGFSVIHSRPHPVPALRCRI